MEVMYQMATTIGICAVIIWAQAIKLIKKNKELKYYKEKSEMLERVVKYDYPNIKGDINNGSIATPKDNAR